MAVSEQSPSAQSFAWLAILCALGFSCRSKELDHASTRTAEDAGAGAGGAVGAGQGGAAGTNRGGAAGASGQPCSGPPSAQGMPSGWEPYPLFGCAHSIYVPPTRALLPAPPVWTDCADRGPDLKACREMAVTWKTDRALATGGQAKATVDETGHVVLQFRNVYDDMARQAYATLGVVAEADGVVRQAFFEPYQEYGKEQYSFGQGGLAKGKSTWILTDLRGTNFRTGALGGADTLLRPPVLAEPDGTRGGLYPGSDYVAEFAPSGALRVLDWAGNLLTTWPSTPDYVSWADSVLTFSQYSPTSPSAWLWTRATGAVPMLGYGDDITRGVASFGTDGTDMVWIEGADRESPEGDFRTRAIYTAPFATSREGLRPKRLRSWQPAFLSASAPAVGCGHAAFYQAWSPDEPAVTSREVLIVRLSDGVAWRVRSARSDPLDQWGLPLALTCDEAFLSTGRNVRRVPLSALGMEIPAD